MQLDRSFVPVVGVVGDVRRDGAFEQPVDMVYLLESFDRPARWSFLVARATGRPADLGRAVLREVLAIDSTVSTDDPQTVSELFAETFATRRRLLMLLGGAASIVVLLTAFSILSALGQFVSGRRRELAIRLALGADRSDVTTLLGRHMAMALGIGLTAGAAIGLVLARMLSIELFGVTATDPWTFVESLVVVALLAVTAAIAPIWRASRINLASALKAQ